MAYQITITYSPANDKFLTKNQGPNIVTAAPIPGLTATEMPGEYDGPSKPYLYAPDGATTPKFLKEKLYAGTGEASAYTDANLHYFTSAQLRWPKAVTNSLINILEAYRTPQIPVYRAWQTFKMAIEGGTYTFDVDTFAQAQFYAEAGRALTDYGFTVTSAENPSITLDKTSLSLVESATGTLTAIATPATATVTWASSNSSVATVSDGAITAGSSAGTCTITASITVDGVTYSAECALTVQAP